MRASDARQLVANYTTRQNYNQKITDAILELIYDIIKSKASYGVLHCGYDIKGFLQTHCLEKEIDFDFNPKEIEGYETAVLNALTNNGYVIDKAMKYITWNSPIMPQFMGGRY